MILDSTCLNLNHRLPFIELNNFPLSHPYNYAIATAIHMDCVQTGIENFHCVWIPNFHVLKSKKKKKRVVACICDNLSVLFWDDEGYIKYDLNSDGPTGNNIVYYGNFFQKTTTHNVFTELDVLMTFRKSIELILCTIWYW